MMKLNGTTIPLPSPMPLSQLLEEQGYPNQARIAVEKNGEIVPRSAYADTWIDDADISEVVSFVGGG